MTTVSVPNWVFDDRFLENKACGVDGHITRQRSRSDATSNFPYMPSVGGYADSGNSVYTIAIDVSSTFHSSRRKVL